MANVVTSSPESGSGECPFAERPSLRSSYLANASQKDIKAQQEKSQTSTDSDTDLSDAKEDDGADIDWYPSFEEYTARVEMLSKTRHTRPTTLPAGYPEVVNTPRAWTGSDFTDKSKYIYMLSEAEVKEIEAALSYFKGSCISKFGKKLHLTSPKQLFLETMDPIKSSRRRSHYQHLEKNWKRSRRRCTLDAGSLS